MQLLVGGIDSGQGNQDIVIKGIKKESIGKDDHLHVSGSRNEKIDGGQSLTCLQSHMSVARFYPLVAQRC
jgi:hypothetical protein